MLVMVMLGCAESSGDPVSLQWYSVDVECVESGAVWVAPPEVVALSLRHHQGEALLYGGGTLAEDGTLSVTCTDDVHILYALEE